MALGTTLAGGPGAPEKGENRARDGNHVVLRPFIATVRWACYAVPEKLTDFDCASFVRSDVFFELTPDPAE